MGQPTTKQQNEKSAEARAPKREIEPVVQLEGTPDADLILDNLQAAAGAGAAPPPPNALFRKLNGAQRVSYVQRLARKRGNGHVQRLLSPEPTLTQINGPVNGRIQRRTNDAAEEEVEITPEQKAAAKAAAAKAAAEAAATKTTGEQQQAASQQEAQTEQAEGVAPQQEVKQSLAEGPVSDAPLKAQEQGAQETQAVGEIQNETKKEQAAATTAAVEQKEKPTPSSQKKAPAPAAETEEEAPAGGGLEGATAAAQQAVAEAYTAADSAAHQSPASPAQDPAHQSAIGDSQAVSQTQQVHPEPETSAAEAQVAAVQPPTEVAGLAQGAQVTEMEQAPAPGFNAAAFKAALMAKIAAATPQTAAQADDFKQSGKLDGVRGAVAGTVSEQKETSQEPLDEKRQAAPDTGAVEPKETVPLQTNEPGPPPGKIGAEGAAPKKKGVGEAEAPVQGGAGALDQQMAEANLTEEQLEQSNEPEFMTALGEKKSAQEAAVTSLPAYRADEESQLASAEAEAAATAEQKLKEMHSGRTAAMSQVDGEQEKTKSADEQKRAEIAGQINQIYAATQSKVNGILQPLDGQVTALFDQGAAEAKTAFENYVTARMNAYKEERYGGWLGWARWAKDKLLSMPSEVNAFYVQGRQLYIDKMTAVIDHIAALISTTLAEAQAAVAEGKQEIQDYIASLPEDLQEIGREAGAAVADKFAELEQSIQDKQGELVDTLAQKYQENLQQIDARIEELKEANKGLVNKALDAVGGVIETVIQLKNLLLEVLASAAAVVEAILQDPIGFLGNLIDAVKMGLNNFIGNLEAHLKQGLMDWLMGAAAEAGIELPEQFDLPGIFSLVMQVLGLSSDYILGKLSDTLGIDIMGVIGQVQELVGVYQEGGMAGLAKYGLEHIIGEEHMGQLMQVLDIVQAVREGGLGALWNLLSEYLTDLKETVMSQITEFIAEKVIKAGVTWLISLFNPAGAFIRACMAIVDLVKFFIENGAKIASLVQSILGSVMSIATGNLTAAAKAIEEALAKAIPITISFLASLLGLGNISGKVKEIITAIRGKVDAALNKILQSKPVQMAAGVIKKIIAKIKAGATAVKDKAIDMGRQAKEKWDNRGGRQEDEEQARREKEARQQEQEDGIPDLTEFAEEDDSLDDVYERRGARAFLKHNCGDSWDVARNHHLKGRLSEGNMLDLVRFREDEVGIGLNKTQGGENNGFLKAVINMTEKHVSQKLAKTAQRYSKQYKVDLQLKPKRVVFYNFGSRSATSDIDYTIDGDGADYAVREFNELFRATYGKESGIMFDANAYARNVTASEQEGAVDEKEGMSLTDREGVIHYDDSKINGYVALMKNMSGDEWRDYCRQATQGLSPDMANQMEAMFREAENRYVRYLRDVLQKMGVERQSLDNDWERLQAIQAEQQKQYGGRNQELRAQNDLYQQKLAQIAAMRLELSGLTATLEALNAPTGDETAADLEKKISRLKTNIRVKINESLLFANESYVTKGGITDVVVAGQSGGVSDNTRQEDFDAFNDSFSHLLHHLHILETPTSLEMAKPDKYLKRIGKLLEKHFSQEAAVANNLAATAAALAKKKNTGVFYDAGEAAALKEKALALNSAVARKFHQG
jgi:hypothetical protein